MRLALLIVVCLAAPTFVRESLAEDATAISYPVLSGVGVALRNSDGSTFVSKVLPDSVAARSEAIREGDEILSVQNGDELIDVHGKSMAEVVSLIRGPVGSTVTLEVRSNDKSPSVKVPLVREAIRLEGVSELTYQQFIGKPAPELEFERLDDSRKVKLSDFRGKIVVIEFWATWCGACYQPVEDLQEVSRSHPEWKDHVVWLAAAVDTDREKAAQVIEDKHWTQTTHVSIDPTTLDALGVRVLPSLMIVSPDGTVATMGGSHALDVEKEVERLLRGSE